MPTWVQNCKCCSEEWWNHKPLQNPQESCIEKQQVLWVPFAKWVQWNLPFFGCPSQGRLSADKGFWCSNLSILLIFQARLRFQGQVAGSPGDSGCRVIRWIVLRFKGYPSFWVRDFVFQWHPPENSSWLDHSPLVDVIPRLETGDLYCCVKVLQIVGVHLL